VDVETLDAVVATLALKDEVLLKLDVQGYECHVIRGAEATLRRTRAVIVETSFQPIYEQQPLFGAVYEALTALGFHYGGSFDQQKSPTNGAPLQEDSIFLRGNLPR
jgi:hypothetical protein